MNLNEALRHVAVIGAGGKMGSGISLLLLEELAMMEAHETGQIGKGYCRLDLIDSSPSSLEGLRIYLRAHIRQMAEREINYLRELFAKDSSLISNEDIVNAFVQGAMDITHPAAEVEEARDAHLVFEAVVEDLHIKTALYRRLLASATKPVNIFSNTSSIPINVLNDAGCLKNRIIGFHFYNPPVVQKLVEIIPLAGGEPLLYGWALELAKRLKKKPVPAKDVAGFIGNGFLLRETLFACAKVRELGLKMPQYQAIYMINKVTERFLVRPMGIFQLLDYVGIDVASRIGQMMNAYLSHGSYDDDLIEKMVASHVLGGQYFDGSQKNGFFQYQNHEITGVYSLQDQRYISLNEGPWKKAADEALGQIPSEKVTWKSLHKDSKAWDKIAVHFEKLSHQDSLGKILSLAFLYRDKEIMQALMNNGAAGHIGDIKAVLKDGFYHLYDPEEAASAMSLEGGACLH